MSFVPAGMKLIEKKTDVLSFVSKKLGKWISITNRTRHANKSHQVAWREIINNCFPRQGGNIRRGILLTFFAMNTKYNGII